MQHTFEMSRELVVSYVQHAEICIYKALQLLYDLYTELLFFSKWDSLTLGH
jgi:hypothetical protein